jgi:hypothetical protein
MSGKRKTVESSGTENVYAGGYIISYKVTKYSDGSEERILLNRRKRTDNS